MVNINRFFDPLWSPHGHLTKKSLMNTLASVEFHALSEFEGTVAREDFVS